MARRDQRASNGLYYAGRDVPCGLDDAQLITLDDGPLPYAQQLAQDDAYRVGALWWADLRHIECRNV